MVKKEFSFKGKSLEELQAMDRDSFAKLLVSRGRRTMKRNFDKTMEKKIDKALKQKIEGKVPKPIRTHLRDTMIVPKMVGLQFAIYNGKTFELRDIEAEMLGHYFGELVLTRKRLRHGKAGIGATKSSTAITAR